MFCDAYGRRGRTGPPHFWPEQNAFAARKGAFAGTKEPRPKRPAGGNFFPRAGKRLYFCTISVKIVGNK